MAQRRTEANWQDVGRELRRQFIARGGRPYDRNWYRVDHSAPHSRRAAYLFGMVARAQSGDPSTLVAYLRSQQKLTQFDRNQLADMFEVIFTPQAKPAKQRGRPKRMWTRVCASVARTFYWDWRDTNQRNGINDWGHGDEMKDEACRLAIEFYVDRLASPVGKDDLPAFQEVRVLMERSERRRR
jgi:hypothetical protein